MASAQLSIELLEHIVDELAKDSDKPSLRACARASSILHSRARHYLFSTIRLASFPPARAFALVELLDADVALGTCVTSLIVSAIRTDWSTRLQPWLYGCGTTWIRMLLPRFTHLTTAEFISLDFRQMPTGALAAALPISLERLVFFDIEFAVDEDVVALLTAVPRLRSVAFCHCVCRPAMVPDCKTYAPTVELEEFEAVPGPGEPYVGRPWLTVVSARRLISLSVTLDNALDISFWQVRINQASATIRELVIKNFTHMNLNLSPLTALRTLVLVFGHHRRTGRLNGRRLMLPLLGALETIASPSFECASFKLSDQTPQVLQGVDWLALRRACESVSVRAPRLRLVFELPRLTRPSMSIMMDCDRIIKDCDRIMKEAIVAHHMEDIVFVNLTM